jgi:hypothetical protein
MIIQTALSRNAVVTAVVAPVPLEPPDAPRNTRLCRP